MEERCNNPEVVTHRLEDKVFEMIRETMIDPAKLRSCLAAPVQPRVRGVPSRLARIARHVVGIEDERKRLIEEYACERIDSREYIEANRFLDEKLARLKREKAEIAPGIGAVDQSATLESSLRQFCERARTELEASVDFDAKRAFLVAHIERVIFNHYKVTLVGSVPVANDPGRKVPFRIDGEIDPNAHRTMPNAPAKPGDGRFKKWNPKLAATAVQIDDSAAAEIIA